jgi:hypothetical protein
VHKAAPANIETHVSSLTFIGKVVEGLLQDYGLNYAGREIKATYSVETTKIKENLVQRFGVRWTRTFNRKPFVDIDGHILTTTSSYAWNKISKAINDFPDWFDKHAKLFEIDDSFTESMPLTPEEPLVYGED